MAPSTSLRPFHSPTRQVLHDYLLLVCQLRYPPNSPIFFPAEVNLLFHKRIMVAQIPFNPSDPSDPPTTTTACFYCTLTTRKIGPTYLIEATAQQVPCWVARSTGGPFSGEQPRDERDGIWLAEPVTRRMVLEKWEGDWGFEEDPGWEDLKRVFVRETQLRESAYFVDGRSGIVDGLDT